MKQVACGCLAKQSRGDQNKHYHNGRGRRTKFKLKIFEGLGLIQAAVTERLQ